METVGVRLLRIRVMTNVIAPASNARASPIINTPIGVPKKGLPRSGGKGSGIWGDGDLGGSCAHGCCGVDIAFYSIISWTYFVQCTSLAQVFVSAIKVQGCFESYTPISPSEGSIFMSAIVVKSVGLPIAGRISTCVTRIYGSDPSLLTERRHAFSRLRAVVGESILEVCGEITVRRTS